MIHLLPKKKIGTSRGEKALFYSSLLLLIICILVYSSFVVIDKRMSREIKETRKLIAQTNSPTELQTENNIKAYEKKLDSFSFILKKHNYPSKVFPLLENDTLKKVYFTSFDLNPTTLNLSLDGSTDSFNLLGEQILVFRNDPLIKSVSLQNISVVSLGMINFSLQISLDPKSIMIQ